MQNVLRVWMHLCYQPECGRGFSLAAIVGDEPVYLVRVQSQGGAASAMVMETKAPFGSAGWVGYAST
jgi:hypothetical protein